MDHGAHSDPYGRPFEAIFEAAVILDATTGRVLLANQAAATILGFSSPDEMVGLNLLDHVPEEDRDSAANLLSQSHEIDLPAPSEIRVKAKDGGLTWASVTSSITEHEGRRAILVTLREMTSQKYKETALMEAQEQYRRLFETMQDGAVVLDTTTGRVVLANQAAANLFGFSSPEEMAGQNPLDYIPEEDRERAARLMADTVEKGYLASAELRIRNRNRRLLWVSIRASLIEQRDRKTTLVTVRDITSEKEKETALREAERRYERLFDGMLDGAVVLDLSSFEIVYANRAAAEMFGFASPVDVVGVNPLSHIPEEDRDGVARLIALNLEGKGTNPAELRVLTIDKRERWVSATATRVDFEGRTAVLATLRDITADKIRDAELKAAEESKLRLMDAAAEAIAVVQDGRLVYVNRALAEGAGIPQEQLIGLPFMDLVHPEEKQAVWERYQRILAGEWSVETRLTKGLNAKGETLWSEIREIPFTWQGKPAVMSLIHDVTDRVRAQEA
ncbi:MAG: PAS domain S-box protein, partial [Dehalococcoidia bacterium]|nr:PAS domain S-box protein [Dehalococcoidia bacterium]